MPAGFTKEFAASLDRICPLDVKEAEDGDLVKPGRILIAPGDYHIYVERKQLATVVRLSHSDLRNGHRPSADVLFESVAKVYENHALGVIMTTHGLITSAKATSDGQTEAFEWKDHPFGIGVQYHPEFLSRPASPHPLFLSFIQAALNNQ